MDSEFTRCQCYTETEEGLSVRDAAKQHKYQGAFLYLRRLHPAARGQHVTFAMSVWHRAMMLAEDWIRKLEDLGLSREAQQAVLQRLRWLPYGLCIP
eukprot:1617273-Rhodomonas_salina.2